MGRCGLEVSVKLPMLGCLGILTAMAFWGSQAQSQSPAGAGSDFAKLADRYFDQYYFPFNPTLGTLDGFHPYDSQLEDYSRSGINRQVAMLRAFEQQVERIDPAKLSLEQGTDWQLVLGDIRSRLLTLEEIRPWEKNPDYYSSGITQSIFAIMERNFAPADQRLKSVTAREKLVPAVFDAARKNLKNPPPVYVEVTLEQLPGMIRFFQNDVPAAFKDAKDAGVLSDFRAANQKVIDSLGQYQNFVEKELKPKARGDFRIGADNYRQKLLYDEDVDISLDRLLETGMANLRQNQQSFRDVAKQIDASKTPQQILEETGKDHPAPRALLQTFRDMLGGLRAYVEEHHIVGVPSQVLPIVEETPPFMRALTFASMDTPGPYEMVAKEAYFNVTLPENSWTPQRIEEHMEGYNRGTLVSTAVHEVYPGHYVQFLWLFSAPTKVRKLLGCSSNAEGWAHYSEQMMLDEGFGRTPGVDVAHDIAFLKLRLGQLQDALLRNARYVVGVQMHTGKMTFDQGVQFFQKERYQTHENSLRETKRGTSDPTYLYYTLGKLEILKLREDYKRKMGSKFSLEDFHNKFLQQGFPPVKLIRRAMLGDNSPAL
jgi:uncharacterized protein (DUF885 family)